MPELIITDDKSHTLFVKELNEHYHSVHGAVGESSVVYIGYGYKYCNADPVSIFEVGFGTGLNVLLTLTESLKDNKVVYYTAIERYPLGNEITCRLNYGLFTGRQGDRYFKMIHNAPWNRPASLTDNFTLTKIEGDFLTYIPSGQYDIIYYDAFGPGKQPEMWSRELIIKSASMLHPDGILVTYSSQGELKRKLKDAGFSLTLLPGPPHKREVIRAVKRKI